MDYRTFTLDFNDFNLYAVPAMAILYATSFENSWGAERQDFYHGKHEVAQIVLNHHTTMSFKMKRTEVLKEKHTDCNEKTYWEVLEKLWYPKVVQNCSNTCFYFELPNHLLPQCTYDHGGLISDMTDIDDQIGSQDGFHSLTIEDEECSKKTEKIVNAEHGDFYSFKSCSIEEYEGRVLRDNVIPGKSEFWYWSESDKQDWELVFPWTDYETNPGNLTMKFSYTFESPSTMTVSVENYIVTFFDLIGIVGGTLGMFIGFAWYDNVLAAGEYLIVMFNWVERIIEKRKAKADVKKKSSKVEHPNQEMPKKEMPKQKMPKQKMLTQEMPKQAIPKQEMLKQDTSNQEMLKQEMSNKQKPKQEMPKQETYKQQQEKDEESTKIEQDTSILQKPLKTENSVDTNPRAETMSQNQHSHKKELAIVDIEHVTKS